jgi:hypothetical protein
MKSDEIPNIIEKLDLLSYDLQHKKLESFSINDLEEMAVNIYEKRPRADRFDILRSILHERSHKLNKVFHWTEEDMKKFLKVNSELLKSFELAYGEALNTADELEKRIKNNDPFIQDYEIKIVIQPYLKDINDKGDLESSIAYVLSEPLSFSYPISYSFSHIHYDHITKEIPIFMDKTLNWNIEYFGDRFKEDYICYAIHLLLNTGIWSFHDITNIGQIWADVEVAHQYNIGDL